MNQHLQENGWVKVERVFTRSEMSEIEHQVRDYAGRKEPEPGNSTTTDISEQGEPAMRKLVEPFFLDARFRNLSFDRRIQELIEPIVGRDPELIFDHFFLKPARCGAPKDWHQDGFYYHIDPPDRGVSVWLALHDADEINGCLEYYSGSHKLGLLPHQQPEGQPALAGISVEPSSLGEPTAVCARKGDVLLHHFHCVHGSGANESASDRFAYASHWFDRRATGGGPAWPRTYPDRSDYRQVMEAESLRRIGSPPGRKKT